MDIKSDLKIKKTLSLMLVKVAPGFMFDLFLAAPQQEIEKTKMIESRIFFIKLLTSIVSLPKEI